MSAMFSRRMRAIVIAAAIGATALTAGCSSSTGTAQSPSPTTPAATTPAPMVMVTNARVNTPVVKDETGAFASVMNNTGMDISLTSVSVPSTYAESAGLHKMAMVNGKMDMVPVASIPIKAGATLELKPGGFHMMLMMPMCKTGDVVPITFTFSDGTTVTANATVQMPTASASPSMKM